MREEEGSRRIRRILTRGASIAFVGAASMLLPQASSGAATSSGNTTGACAHPTLPTTYSLTYNNSKIPDQLWVNFNSRNIGRFGVKIYAEGDALVSASGVVVLDPQANSCEVTFAVKGTQVGGVWTTGLGSGQWGSMIQGTWENDRPNNVGGPASPSFTITP
jgi:hypothetical protein